MTATEEAVIDLTATEPEPVPPPSLEVSARRRWSRKMTGFTLIGVGVFLLGFLAFEFLASSLVQRRSQEILLQEFRATSTEGPATTLDWVPALGDPVAILTIPKLGVDDVMVEGTGPLQMMKGPGHLRGTPLPGRPGNSVIAGRRTTFGAPFRNLHALVPGDIITVYTPVGAFSYRVESVSTVTPGGTDVLGPTVDSRLTLITSDPAYVATGRLVVTATLSGLPAAEPTHVVPSVATSELGLASEGSAVPALLVWGELLILAVLGTLWARRRLSSGRVAWLLGTPVILALTWAVYLALSRLLPATL
jgi:sortase A